MRKKFTKIFCVLFRHSNIEDNCFGYKYCGRCGEQVGDTLGSVYINPSAVGLQCGCSECRENWHALTFADKFMATKPEWLRYSLKEWEEIKDKRYKEAMSSLQSSLATYRSKK